MNTFQPLRDLELNFGVDLAQNLGDYLIIICSAQISHNNSHQIHINFAQAALLLQDSVQVYSRKVEYLYSLVLHALEFVSDKRQKEQPEGASTQSEENPSGVVDREENDQFSGWDDIPVDVKNSLDSTTSKDSHINKFVKPPANLVVLDGDCLDSTGDGSELESYLLGTAILYHNFILLDPCDTIAVNSFLKNNVSGKMEDENCRSDFHASKSQKSAVSPSNRSGGTPSIPSARKNSDTLPNESPPINHGFEFNDHNTGPDSAANESFENHFNDFEMDDRYSEPGDLDEDEDDPWKPLNPHEPETLRVKPFRRVKSSRKQTVNTHKRVPITRVFPLARMHGPVSSELIEIWEARHNASETRKPQVPPIYEQLRESLVHGAQETSNAFGDPVDANKENDHNDHDVGFDFDPPDFDHPGDGYNHEDVPIHPGEHVDGDADLNNHEYHGQEDPGFQPNLEYLCRSHLDFLLASIAETEKQTELALRVSTWKQKIEKNLEEQDSCPPFDIHKYGERVLEKLPLEADSVEAMSFSDVVSGQEKHDIARTFSALLQLVNNGDVVLVKNCEGDELSCYTGENPFHVRLLNHEERPDKAIFGASKKRAKSPAHRGFGKEDAHKSLGEEEEISHSPSKLMVSVKASKLMVSVNVNKVGSIKRTPKGKRRRRSMLVEPAGSDHVG